MEFITAAGSIRWANEFLGQQEGLQGKRACILQHCKVGTFRKGKGGRETSIGRKRRKKDGMTEEVAMQVLLKERHKAEILKGQVQLYNILPKLPL